MLSTDKTSRKERPMARGLLDYFPDALAEVAHVSFVGNQQHNPGEELHWAREKSDDHADCIIRHLADRGKADNDETRHSAKVAWRALALLQLELEEQQTEEKGEDTAPTNDPSSGGLVMTEFGYLPAEPLDDEEADQYDDEPMVHSRRIIVVESDGTAVVMPESAFKLWKQRTPDEDEDRAFTRPLDETERIVFGDRLRDQGCCESVIREILGGVAVPTGEFRGVEVDPGVVMRKFYIAGPMRGYPHYNYPAFDAARDRLAQMGHVTISPADIDRAAGEGDLPEEAVNTAAQQGVYAYRDFHALKVLSAKHGDGVAVLPGWEASTGATAEVYLARWLGLSVIDALTGESLDALDPEALLASLCHFLRDQQK